MTKSQKIWWYVYTVGLWLNVGFVAPVQGWLGNWDWAGFAFVCAWLCYHGAEQVRMK